MASVMSVLCVCLMLMALVRAQEKYTTRFDNINVDQILKSERLINNYATCILDKGRCTPDGKEVKLHLPEAMTDGCSKCSEKQKEIGSKILIFLYTYRRSLFDEVAKKYDPTGIYRKKYEKSIVRSR